MQVRHRALLFKLLAQLVGIKCRLETAQGNTHGRDRLKTLVLYQVRFTLFGNLTTIHIEANKPSLPIQNYTRLKQLLP